VWQRVVAAASETELRIGGMVGCAAVVLTVFLFGMAGFLAAWGGLIDPLRDDPNLYLFQLFKRSGTDSAKVGPCFRPATTGLRRRGRSVCGGGGVKVSPPFLFPAPSFL